MPILAVPAILKPVPPLMSPLTPKPPTIIKAPLVEEVEFVFDRIDTEPTKVEVDWTLNPEPILAVPVILSPVPPFISPDTPKPPTIVNAPVVEDVELVFDRIDTEPTSVEVD